MSRLETYRTAPINAAIDASITVRMDRQMLEEFDLRCRDENLSRGALLRKLIKLHIGLQNSCVPEKS